MGIKQRDLLIMRQQNSYVSVVRKLIAFFLRQHFD